MQLNLTPGRLSVRKRKALLAVIPLALLGVVLVLRGILSSSPPAIPREWTDPQEAIGMAMTETGSTHSVGMLQTLYNNAVPLRDAYPLLAAPIGAFQPDPRGYYPWLVDHMQRSESQFLTSEDSGYLQLQANAAIRTPDSPIAQQLRRIAAGKDPARPVPDGGEFAYWTYLIRPAVLLNASGPQVILLYSDFESLVYSYRIDQQKHAISAQEDFADYLLHSSYFSKWSLLITGIK